MVEFESLRTGKKFDFIELVVQTEWWGLLLKGGMREEIQVYAKFLEILLGAKIEEVKDIFVTLEEVEGAKTE